MPVNTRASKTKKELFPPQTPEDKKQRTHAIVPLQAPPRPKRRRRRRGIRLGDEEELPPIRLDHLMVLHACVHLGYSYDKEFKAFKDRDVAFLKKTTGRFLVEFFPSREVMYQLCAASSYYDLKDHYAVLEFLKDKDNKRRAIMCYLFRASGTDPRQPWPLSMCNADYVLRNKICVEK